MIIILIIDMLLLAIEYDSWLIKTFPDKQEPWYSDDYYNEINP